MQIGEVIRIHRKEKNMTQEEMAKRLGVTAPAVNKWENGNSYPDIMLLAPIARLLGISLDTLLSFHGDLTETEVEQLAAEAGNLFQTGTYAEAFDKIKQMMEQYPNSEQLSWQLTVILDANRMLYPGGEDEKYDYFVRDSYRRMLHSEQEQIRQGAAEMMYSMCVRNQEYEEAGRYLEYFSKQDPKRKEKQAVLYRKTGKTAEAKQAYEELLFACYQQMDVVLNGMRVMALDEQDMEKAGYYTEKQVEMVGLFEMGAYYAAAARLELAAAEKDRKKTMEIAEKMIAGIDTLDEFTSSPLYEHMTFRPYSPGFTEMMKQRLLDSFRDEETFDFMKGDPQWERILEER